VPAVEVGNPPVEQSETDDAAKDKLLDWFYACGDSPVSTDSGWLEDAGLVNSPLRDRLRDFNAAHPGWKVWVDDRCDSFPNEMVNIADQVNERISGDGRPGVGGIVAYFPHAEEDRFGFVGAGWRSKPGCCPDVFGWTEDSYVSSASPRGLKHMWGCRTHGLLEPDFSFVVLGKTIGPDGAVDVYGGDLMLASVAGAETLTGLYYQALEEASGKTG